MQYPLTERIGHPNLLVGRHEEFARIDQWLRGIHKQVSWSTALLARKKSGFARTWADYIDLAVDRINNVHARRILLFLTKYADRQWTHREIKEALKLDIDLKDLLRRLIALADTDLIEEGRSDVHFQGLQDGTLYLILRNRFHEEVQEFEQDLKQDFQQHYEKLKQRNHQLQGKLNQLAGKIVEDLLATELRSRKRIQLWDFFESPHKADLDSSWNLAEVRVRSSFQRPDGKSFEIDVLAKTENGLWLVIETKKTKAAIGKPVVENFFEKLGWLQAQHSEPTLTGAFVALGGFTEEALEYCQTHHILTASRLFFIDHFFEDSTEPTS